MSVIPGRRSRPLSRWLVYLAALLVAVAATALLLKADDTAPRGGAMSAATTIEARCPPPGIEFSGALRGPG